MHAEVLLLIPTHGHVRTVPATLSMEHPAASYGRPVLVVDGIAYGPADRLPWGELAATVVMGSTTEPLVRELRRRWTAQARGYLKHKAEPQLTLGGA